MTRLFSRIVSLLLCFGVSTAWAQGAPSAPPAEPAQAATEQPPAGDELAYALRPEKIKIARLFQGVWFGRKTMAVAPCTPSTPAGQAIMGDLHNRVGVALAKDGLASSVGAMDGPDAPGCPDKAASRKLAQKANVEYLILVELDESSASEGRARVVLHLLDDKGNEEGTYEPEGLVIAGPANSKPILKARLRTRFQRQAWTKDYRVTTTRVYQRGMVNTFTTRTPIIMDPSNKELFPDDVQATPGMEGLSGRASTLKTTGLLSTILSYARWGFCLGGPVTGGCLGALAAIPVAVVGMTQGAGPAALGAIVGGLAGGVVLGCIGGGVGLCLSTGVQDIVSLVAHFARGSYVDQAVNIHNRGVAEEMGLDPKDMDEEYFPE